jgi:hypothetical protein
MKPHTVRYNETKDTDSITTVGIDQACISWLVTSTDTDTIRSFFLFNLSVGLRAEVPVPFSIATHYFLKLPVILQQKHDCLYILRGSQGFGEIYCHHLQGWPQNKCTIACYHYRYILAKCKQTFTRLHGVIPKGQQHEPSRPGTLKSKDKQKLLCKTSQTSAVNTLDNSTVQWLHSFLIQDAPGSKFVPDPLYPRVSLARLSTK